MGVERHPQSTQNKGGVRRETVVKDIEDQLSAKCVTRPRRERRSTPRKSSRLNDLSTRRGEEGD